MWTGKPSPPPPPGGGKGGSDLKEELSGGRGEGRVAPEHEGAGDGEDDGGLQPLPEDLLQRRPEEVGRGHGAIGGLIGDLIPARNTDSPTKLKKPSAVMGRVATLLCQTRRKPIQRFAGGEGLHCWKLRLLAS